MYSLRCPFTVECRYVGKADRPEKRLRQHITSAIRGERSHKANWIRSLLSQGVKPILEIEDEVPLEEWETWEREWIRFYRALGCRLVNQTEGGEGGGVVGSVQTAETRAKISVKNKGKAAWNRGVSATPGHKAAMSAGGKGKKMPPWSEERRAKMRLAKTGKKRPPFSAEWRLNLSLASKGSKRPSHPPEVRAKISAARKGKPGHPQTAETREKQSKAAKARYERERAAKEKRT